MNTPTPYRLWNVSLIIPNSAYFKICSRGVGNNVVAEEADRATYF